MGIFRKAPRNSIKARDEPGRTSADANAHWRQVERTRADITIRVNEAIYAAVSRISNTVASMPLHLYKGDELQARHPMERMLAYSPNPNFTPFGFLQTMEAFRNTEGNAYALIVPGKLGDAKRLDILNPTRVRPQRHPETGEIWYFITLDDGKRYPLPGFQLIVIRHLSANGEIGIRPIDVLRSSLEYDKLTKDMSLDQLEGVNQGIFLEVPGTAVDDDRTDALVNRFMANYEKSGRHVVVLDGGMKATPFKETAIDAQVLDVERITRNRVATVYNIPPHLLGDYTDTSFNTAEQQMQEFLQLTILPIAVQWEQELNRKLLTPSDFSAGYRFKFDVDALARADTLTMANKHQKAIRSSWMTINEVRAKDNLPKLPNGDELMASRDLLPLRIAMEQPELLLGGKASGEKGGTNE